MHVISVAVPDPPLHGHLHMGEPFDRRDAIEPTPDTSPGTARPWLPVTGEFLFALPGRGTA